MRAIQQKIAEDDPLGDRIDADDLNGGGEATPQGDLHCLKVESVTLVERFAIAAPKQIR